MEATQAQKPQVNRSNNWWQVRHDEKLIEAKNKNVDVLLLGDSITHGWEKGGRENIWQQYYPGLTHFNLGFSGDRTEHVLWRIQHGSVDHLQAKLTILMIGTNNTGHRMDPAKHTALGVKAIIDALQSKIPNTKILLLGIFPRQESPYNDMRRRNDQINKVISAYADNKNITYLNINQKLLNNENKLDIEIMPDLLHPNNKGYHIWAEAMQALIMKLLK